mmetsp:Transcript_56476/g.100611  ORF Transcript_56476/g.100611 Transcript_56476/m.100611 type:complete len:109 (-) Transcript_56476:1271-1597(-)
MMLAEQLLLGAFLAPAAHTPHDTSAAPLSKNQQDSMVSPAHRSSTKKNGGITSTWLSKKAKSNAKSLTARGYLTQQVLDKGGEETSARVGGMQRELSFFFFAAEELDV